LEIVNFGSLNLDYVYTLSHIVTPGETISSKSFSTFAGGKGLNQSIALARAGARVTHAGMAGSDGQMLVDLLAASGVETRFIHHAECCTGHAIIQITETGENAIVLHSGANKTFTREFVDNVLSQFRNDTMILLQNEINLCSYIIDAAYDKGMKIALNPSPYDKNLKECDLSKVSVFILNEVEGGQITGFSDSKDILRKMQEMYPDALVVLTLGAKGSILCYQDEEYRNRAYHVPVIDSTAAGDTFTGFFLCAYIAGDSLDRAMDFASKAASLAIMKKGAADSIPTARSVLASTLSQRQE